jgi:hypothetical protein
VAVGRGVKAGPGGTARRRRLEGPRGSVVVSHPRGRPPPGGGPVCGGEVTPDLTIGPGIGAGMPLGSVAGHCSAGGLHGVFRPQLEGLTQFIGFARNPGGHGVRRARGKAVTEPLRRSPWTGSGSRRRAARSRTRVRILRAATRAIITPLLRRDSGRRPRHRPSGPSSTFAW